MKIIDIFADVFPGHLFSVVWDDINALDVLFQNWTSVLYLRNYAHKNSIKNVKSFVTAVTEEIGTLDAFFIYVVERKVDLNQFFRPLYNAEYFEKVLSLQKGKFKNHMLRIYAIKIESNCFLITGGAIKLTHTMQEHPDTLLELKKLNKVKNFLINEGILDKDSIEEYVLDIN